MPQAVNGETQCSLTCCICDGPVRGRQKPGTEGGQLLEIEVEPCRACVADALRSSKEKSR